MCFVTQNTSLLKAVKVSLRGLLLLLYRPSNAFSLARVEVPTVPVPLVKPAGVRMVEAYFSWNFTTAALVAEPNRVVSFPGEPAPDEETWVSELWLSNA